MSYQSKLTDDIAEELAQEQRSISVAEFFEKNKHMLGFDSGARGLVTAVKEGVDNSLDACEEAEILPDIFVEIEELDETYRLVIEDNGPGIVRKQIPKIFGKLLYGSRFGKRVQSRGQQGIGISAAVLYSQLTSGKPAKIVSKTESGEAHEFEITIDTDTNDPEILSDEIVDWDRTHGTRIEIELEANMRARKQLHTYIKNTAVVNPHARIRLREPENDFEFERATDELPEKAEEIKPHPHGIELGTLIRMLESTDSYNVGAFVRQEFTRVGSKTSDEILDEFRDRHYGREMAWSTPSPDGVADMRQSVIDSVSNKTTGDTRKFADHVVENLLQHETLAGFEIRDEIDDAAEKTQDETGTTFGETVRQKAAEAVASFLTEDTNPVDDVHEIVESATTTSKDAETVEEISKILAPKLVRDDEGEDETEDRLGSRAVYDDVTEYVDRAADSVEELRDVRVGETARKNIVDEIWDTMRTVPDDVPLVREVAEDRDTARLLLDSMRATDVMSPPTGCLSPITPDLMEKGLRKEFDAEFYSTATRDASVHGGDPFVVEAGIAYGGSLHGDSKADLLRFANRVPLVYQQGACVITDAVEGIGWRNYGLSQSSGSLPEGPLVIMVHVASTNVPFTSESKDAVAGVPEIHDEVELAVREVARDLKDHLSKQRSRQKRKKKERVIGKILPEMAEKVAEITGKETPEIDETVAEIMNKVYVSVESDGGSSASVEVTNHSNSGECFELHIFTDAEPSVDGNTDGVEVVDLDGEYDLVWNVDLAKGESASIEYSAEGESEIQQITAEGIEDDLIQIHENNE
ncbi:MAG: DNA topoisomerase VI subunit B [Halobacteria archaeon]|nr:DNA topoisomerase VI subunit B [Halobacteria archaeon]